MPWLIVLLHWQIRHPLKALSLKFLPWYVMLFKHVALERMRLESVDLNNRFHEGLDSLDKDVGLIMLTLKYSVQLLLRFWCIDNCYFFKHMSILGMRPYH